MGIIVLTLEMLKILFRMFVTAVNLLNKKFL
jgi:hypothetical protein